MTTAEQVTRDLGPDQHPLAPGADPAVIREHLLESDRVVFDAALSTAEATRNGDRVWDCVEHWRAIAVIQSDRDAFTRLARRTAERATGQPSPADEPLDVTRAKAGI